MKILFLCGYFDSNVEKEIIKNAKAPIEYSANVFQRKMIDGLRKFSNGRYEFSVLSAPFVGSYPNACNRMSIKAFPTFGECQYVGFHNTWGLRNISRANVLKKALKSFISSSDQEKRIIVYSVHTPFLEAAVYAKKKDPNIRICLIVPDLPQYMNLNSHISVIYKLGKKFDIWWFNKLNVGVDGYVLLTEQMKEKIDTFGKPAIIVEGVLEDDVFLKNKSECKEKKKKESIKYVVYTGKLNEKFGIKNLVDAFMQITNPAYRLILCGRGELDSYIKQCSTEDSRIIALGQVKPEMCRAWQYRADVLVNPRKNSEEYTRYSFPSKNLEYLATGVPVVAHFLSGMPVIYKKFIFCIDEGNDEIGAIKSSIEDAIMCYDYSQKYRSFKEYAENNLTVSSVVSRMLGKVI